MAQAVNVNFRGEFIMVVKATLSKNDKLTKEQIDEIENAKSYPITYDEDSPELTDAME